MTIRWQQGESATPFVGEADKMAAMLEARHGSLAAEIAEFFSDLHACRGNAIRALAWADAADAVRSRVEGRVSS